MYFQKVKTHNLPFDILTKYTILRRPSCFGVPGTVDIQRVSDLKGNAGYIDGYIEDPGFPLETIFYLCKIDGEEDKAWASEHRSSPTFVEDPPYVPVPTDPTLTPHSEGDTNMVGNVYEGVVVKTTQVAAGDGITSGVKKSEIVLVVPPFMAKDTETAKALVLAQAIGEKMDLNDPTQEIEARVRIYA